MSNSHDGDRWRLRTEILSWTRAGEEVIVLDLENSHYFSANASAAPLWDALATGATHAELATTLSDTFGVESATADSDAAAFLADLRSRGLAAQIA